MFLRDIRSVLGLSFAALWICACEGTIHPIDVDIEAEPGVDISGINVRFNDGNPSVMVKGHLHAEVKGSSGSKVKVEITLPDHLTTKELTAQTFLLADESDGKPHAIHFVLPVERKRGPGEREYHVEIGKGCAGQEVVVDGAKLGVVEDDGSFFHAIAATKGATVRIALAAREGCEPLNCSLVLGDKDRLKIDTDCPREPEGDAEELTDAQRREVEKEKQKRDQEEKANADREEREEKARALEEQKRAAREEQEAKRKELLEQQRAEKAAAEEARKREQEEKRAEKAAADATRKREQEEKRAEDAARKMELDTKRAADAEAKKKADEEKRAAAVEAKQKAEAEKRAAADAKKAADEEKRAAAKEKDEERKRQAEEKKREEEEEREAKRAAEEEKKKAEEAAKKDKVGPPPPGQVQIKVSCTPAGMELLVDNKLAVSKCSELSALNITPGAHTFRLHAPQGAEPCPGADPITQVIPKKGMTAPLAISVDCRLKTCVERVRGGISGKKAVPDADLTCLSSVAEGSPDFVESRILLSHVYDVQKKDAKRAEEVLAKLVGTQAGHASAEAHYRLADLLGRRKEYDKERQHADIAWTNRQQFAAMENGTSRMLGVRRLRAAAFEGLFYNASDRVYFDKAMAEYQLLAREASEAGPKGEGDKWAAEAKKGLARLEEQEKNSKVSLEK